MLLAVYFLKKLSIFEENKTLLLESNAVEILIQSIPCNSDKLLKVSPKYRMKCNVQLNRYDIMILYDLVDASTAVQPFV